MTLPGSGSTPGRRSRRRRNGAPRARRRATKPRRRLAGPTSFGSDRLSLTLPAFSASSSSSVAPLGAFVLYSFLTSRALQRLGPAHARRLPARGLLRGQRHLRRQLVRRRGSTPRPSRSPYSLCRSRTGCATGRCADVVLFLIPATLFASYLVRIAVGRFEPDEVKRRAHALLACLATDLMRIRSSERCGRRLHALDPIRRDGAQVEADDHHDAQCGHDQQAQAPGRRPSAP